MAGMSRDGRVQRVVTVLDVVCRGEGSAPTFQDVVSATQLPKATVFRLLEDLEAQGVVYRFHRRYFAGYRIFSWASAVSEVEMLAARAKPALGDLRDAVQETVSLMHFAGDRRVCLVAVPGTRAIRHVLRAGDDFPLFSGASGRVLLSALPAEEVRRLWERMSPHQAGEGDEGDWRRVIELIQRDQAQGWAASVGERDANLAAVAVPVRVGAFRMAISVSGPRDEFSEEVIPTWVAAAQRAAEQISRTTRATEEGTGKND